MTAAEAFYTQVLGSILIRRIEPTDEQRSRGRVKAVDVQLGNFQVQFFDASEGARAGVPHHTVTVPGYEKDLRVQELERSGTRVEKNSRNHPDGKGYSLYVQGSRRQSLGALGDGLSPNHRAYHFK